LVPKDFASKSLSISIDQARNILSEMGVKTPSRLRDNLALNNYLNEVTHLKPEQVNTFLQKALKLAKPVENGK
jgi:DNA-directed RNA polymerase subunit F